MEFNGFAIMNIDIEQLYEDPWFAFQGQMAEDFFKYHRDNMPENPHDVWKIEEVMKFCYAFTLFAAEMKFKRKHAATFLNREMMYKSILMVPLDQDGSGETLSCILGGYEQYVQSFKSGFSSIFSAITKGVYKPACKIFVNNACKRYIFSERDMVKIVTYWITDKNMEFDKTVLFE